MPPMAPSELRVCRSAAWGALAGRVVLPWALHGERIGPEVLEIGSGAGAMAEELLARHRDVRLAATDLDETMVADAEQRLARFGDRATVRRADATGLPFGDESFDTVLSFAMLHHVIEWEKALAEALRVLRPGGSLVGYDLLATRFNRAVHLVDRSPHRLFSFGELRAVVDDLPVDRAVLVPGLGGLVARFSLRKRGPSS
ncbi:MAG TPA: class I SAM-dependent methyltransferase [Acidimicrobiales bacterium]|nr:class I SAM-dependent methyltransferase [Acidimicrobiales bacterium]